MLSAVVQRHQEPQCCRFVQRNRVHRVNQTAMNNGECHHYRDGYCEDAATPPGEAVAWPVETREKADGTQHQQHRRDERHLVQQTQRNLLGGLPCNQFRSVCRRCADLKVEQSLRKEQDTAASQRDALDLGMCCIFRDSRPPTRLAPGRNRHIRRYPKRRTLNRSGPNCSFICTSQRRA